MTISLQERIKELEAKVQKGSCMTTYECKLQPPFNEEIMEEVVLQNFKFPQIDLYNGMDDPVDHLAQYQTTMLFQGASDALLCRGFPITLRKGAREWFQALGPRSVNSFKELAEQFVARFMSSKKPKKASASFFQLKQQRDETLREYVTRFRTELFRVQDLEESVAVAAFTDGVQSGKFCFSISKSTPKTLAKLFTKAEKYITAEELMAA